MPRYSSTVHGGGKWRGLSHAKKRVSVCNHSPIMRARRSRSAGQVCGLGGLFAVVTVDGLFQQVTHLRTRTSHNRHQAPKIGPPSRHDNLRFFVGDAYQSDFGAPRFKQDSHKLDHHPSAAFRFARRHGDLADRSGRLRQLRQQRLPQQNSDRNGSRQDDQSGPHFRNARDVEWSRVRKPHSPISAPRVAQKIKRQHYRIDERLQGLGCAVVVVRHDDPLLRHLRSLGGNGEG